LARPRLSSNHHLRRALLRVVDNINDVVTEANGEGIDLVRSTVNGAARQVSC